MSQNVRNNVSDHTSTVNRLEVPQVGQIIEALKIKYATNAEVLLMLSGIALKVQQVPIGVRQTVAELLQANLDSQIANMGTITAVIMAINSQHRVLKAANDKQFQSAA